MERAQTIAAQIQSGALPLVLTQQKVDTVSATLGDDALSTSVLAAIIGILLVMAVMIGRYRLNGVVASWALCIYIIVLFLLLAVLPGIQLTLPGLAGIVLGIGMAVDANVIIFERFNEEIRAGRAIRAAVRTGFKNAMSAILDANVTTLIAAIVLMFFGTGSIQGFAKTLLLGVITSMFTAVVVTRFLMKNIVNLGVKNSRLFTAAAKAEKEEQE
jgi:protein-export membrane protein SecD